jgi:hypothetical protein
MKRSILQLIQVTLLNTTCLFSFISLKAQPDMAFSSFSSGLSSPVDMKCR